MKICDITQNRIDDFFEFNKKIDTTRDDVVERLNFLIFDNPLLTDKSNPYIIAACNENDQIVGQHLLTPFEYYYGGNIQKGYYAFDLYLLKEYRKKGIGYLLTQEAYKRFFPYFGIGTSEAATRIHFSLKNKIIGNLYIYMWIRKISSLFRFVLNEKFKDKFNSNNKEVREFQFPEELSIRGFSFKRVRSLEQWEHHNWNDEILEFSRSLEFLKWRFLIKQNKYFFYLLVESDSTTYFVVRRIVTKGLNLLAIVDYRVPFEDQNKFKLILRAVKLLAKSGGFDGVFTMSSYGFFDKILRKNLFIKKKDPIHIFANARFNIPQEIIDERRFVFATMAESDLDFYFEL